MYILSNNFMRKINFKNKQSGFTLLESIVAIGIFLLGAFASIGAIGQSLKFPYKAAERTQAVYLAYEGVNLARNMISNDILKSDVGNVSPGTSKVGCVEYDKDYLSVPGSISDCFGAGVTKKIDFLSFSDGFKHSLAVNQKFTREVSISYPGAYNNKVVVITSTVTYGNGKSVTLTEYVSNYLTGDPVSFKEQ